MRCVLLAAAMAAIWCSTAPASDAAVPQVAAPQGPLAVLVTSPLMNADIGEGATVTLTAAPSAQRDAIARVDFLDNGELVGTVTQAPYQLAYHPPVSKRNFRITARAIDAAGHTAVSPRVLRLVRSALAIPPKV